MKTIKFSWFFAICLGISILCNEVQAKTKVVRKVQEVSFDETSLKGTVRNPDGAFLVTEARDQIHAFARPAKGHGYKDPQFSELRSLNVLMAVTKMRVETLI